MMDIVNNKDNLFSSQDNGTEEVLQTSSLASVSSNKSFVFIVDDFDIIDNNPIKPLIVYDSKKHRRRYKKVLVMSGGGIRGIAHIGVLQALSDNDYLDKIEEFAGTSIGALILGMYIIGYSPEELWNFILNFDFTKIKCISINNIIYHYGLDSGKKIEYIMKRLIQAKGFNSDITLQQLFDITKKKLMIATVCLNTQQICYISYENHPNLPLCLAIRMSISIPIYYTPVIHNNMYYIDGGFIDNYPIGLYKDRLDDVIGIYLVESKNITNKIENLEMYLFLVMQCLMEGVTYNAINGYEKYTIQVNLKPIIALNYNVTNDKKKEMYECGYQSTIKYLNKK